MEENKFYEGQKLAAILVGDIWIRTSPKRRSYHSNEFTCIDIIVVMESGQMSGVPWAVVTYGNGQVEKYNLALVTAVNLAGRRINND